MNFLGKLIYTSARVVQRTDEDHLLPQYLVFSHSLTNAYGLSLQILACHPFCHLFHLYLGCDGMTQIKDTSQSC
jgi:hypothetical protein